MSADAQVLRRAALEKAVISALTSWGIEGNQGDIHSWRCEHPDRYGQCEDVANLTADLLAEVEKAIRQTPINQEASW